MHLPTALDAPRNDITVVRESCPKLDQADRIVEALGSVSHIPMVDEEMLSRYYKYLTEHLRFPFIAHFLTPMNSEEDDEFRCTVLKLLDPAQHLGNRFDGIFAKTNKGKYEINLPLIELEVPDDSPNFEFIEDYWYWFWNWR
jgi:hypothetical protein